MLDYNQNAWIAQHAAHRPDAPHQYAVTFVDTTNNTIDTASNQEVFGTDWGSEATTHDDAVGLVHDYLGEVDTLAVVHIETCGSWAARDFLAACS